MPVDTYLERFGAQQDLRYLFVAYTTEQFDHNSRNDMEALHQIAETAARAAGVPAYWVACSCMPEPENLQDDVSCYPHHLVHLPCNVGRKPNENFQGLKMLVSLVRKSSFRYDLGRGT